MKKRSLLKELLVSFMLLCAAHTWAYDFYVDGIYYNISSSTDRTCAVTGYDVTDTSASSFNSVAYKGSVEIPMSVTYNNVTYAVTSIGNNAFFWCKDLTKVTIPNSVTRIGDSVFFECSSLTDVSIASSVTSLGSFAFYSCTSLKEITIPNSVTSISDMTFCGCTSLTEVTIGKKVTSIGDCAFQACTKLKSVYSFNPEPPTCRSAAFYEIDVSSITLYVPYGSKDAYSTADVWKDFYRIGEVDGIDNISIDNQAEIVGFYSIDGKQLNSPLKGINIIRYSDGTTRKVLEK